MRMAEKIHPLVRTYDELNRVYRRLEYVLLTHSERNEEVEKIEELQKEVDRIMNMIPEKYRLTKHQWEKKSGVRK